MKSDVYETGISDHHKQDEDDHFLGKLLLKANQKPSFIAAIKILIKILLMKQ